MNTFFTEETVKILNEDLAAESVKTRKGTGEQKLSYLPAFHVIDEANRIFGFGNWSTEIMHLHQADKTLYEKPGYKADDPKKEMISICYTCQLKLTVTNGERTVSHEDTGFGNGVAGNNAYGVGSCIELATKEAVTDALKRCLRYYGNKFGLSLYDKDVELIGSADIEDARIVEPEQLRDLRDLYERRGVSDEWVLTAIQAENYPHESLELMRNDWFRRAYQITKEYKLPEIEREDYDKDIESVINMMSESANVNMLKALFKEAWQKTQKYDDKDRQQEAQKIYNSMKAKFEANND